MNDTDNKRIEDFIFVRELNEVFLLLDHISGRWDKSLHSTGVVNDGSPHIADLVAISIIPAKTERDRVAQAVTLLCAKDKLNAAARPATGLTVAFTLLVVGEENRRDWKSWFRNLVHKARGGGSGLVVPSRNAPYWDNPTRLTLARYAFPCLVKAADRFNRNIFRMVLLLLLGLIATCVMSWHVAGGNMILQHLDALKQQHAAVIKQISEAELKYTAEPTPPVQFCVDTSFRSTEEYQLCTRRRQIENQLQAVRGNLRIWLQPWKQIYTGMSRWLVMPVSAADDDVRRRGTGELAQIVTMVVGTAVLPLCYGILGASAAVVRGLWAKTRESLLSPRDYTLAILQLALGATIGACIALFITPAGDTAAQREVGLLGTWALSGSALSFIAGFGVDSVFQGLESFVRRVFNIPDTKRLI